MGCGASAPPTATAHPAGPPGASTRAGEAETFECRLDRLAILDTMADSRRNNACTTATECRVVTGPGSPSPEHAEVVFGADADALDARAQDHLRRCGAFHHDEPIDAYREIEAACDESHCVAHETLMHPDPIE